jgi:uncharacterized protein (UPF0335 family)
MKKINFKNLNERNDYSLTKFIGGIEMEFIKKGDNYLIKNSNGRIVSEKEKLQLEKNELILEDIKSDGCQGKTTKKISKINKKMKKSTDDTIKETDTTI